MYVHTEIMNQYCTEVHVHSSTRSEAITGTRVAASEKREWGGDRLSPAPIKDRQAVDGGDQRLRETVGDCEPDRLERERELLALLSQVVLWACVSKDAIGLRTNARYE